MTGPGQLDDVTFGEVKRLAETHRRWRQTIILLTYLHLRKSLDEARREKKETVKYEESDLKRNERTLIPSDFSSEHLGGFFWRVSMARNFIPTLECPEDLCVLFWRNKGQKNRITTIFI